MDGLNLVDLAVEDTIFERMVELRRELHRHPELSLEEEETAQRIAHAAEQLGLEVRRNVGGHGVVVDIPGAHPEAGVIALRADTDALPVHEETGRPFASAHPGIMHACGHDGHSAMLLGAAALLLEEDPPPATVRLLWQPAEEMGGGALSMMEAGVLEEVRYIFGSHIDVRYPPGTLVVTEGAVNASTDEFSIDIGGRQGHGARPHEAVDAVVVGSNLVSALQSIVSRELDPGHPGVITVGSFHAGTAPNIIAGSARLEGTIRSLDPTVRTHLQEAMARMVDAMSQLHRANIRLQIDPGTPPLINTPEAYDMALEAARQVAGEDQVRPLETVNMGGEDFACYLGEVSGCYIGVGAALPDVQPPPAADSGTFDFDERALAVGAAWFNKVARVAGARLTEDL